MLMCHEDHSADTLHLQHSQRPFTLRILNLPLLLLVATLLAFHVCIVRKELTTLEYILAGAPGSVDTKP